MPTKQKVQIKRKAEEGKVAISLSVTFDADDQRAPAIYRGVAKFLGEWMTPDERQDFMNRLNEAKKKSGIGGGR